MGRGEKAGLAALVVAGVAIALAFRGRGTGEAEEAPPRGLPVGETAFSISPEGSTFMVGVQMGQRPHKIAEGQTWRLLKWPVEYRGPGGTYEAALILTPARAFGHLDPVVATVWHHFTLKLAPQSAPGAFEVAAGPFTFSPRLIPVSPGGRIDVNFVIFRKTLAEYNLDRASQYAERFDDDWEDDVLEYVEVAVPEASFQIAAEGSQFSVV